MENGKEEGKTHFGSPARGKHAQTVHRSTAGKNTADILGVTTCREERWE